jgi:hypothetical protein
MRLIFKALLCFCLVVSARAQLLTVTSTNLTDSSNVAVSNATVTFAPVLNTGQPASYRKGTASGQVIIKPVSATVTAGAFSLVVVDTSLTNPANICYAVMVTDNITGANLLGAGYSCVQPTTTASWCGATNCNFDAFPPNLSPMLPFVTGPVGPQGAPGGSGSVATRLTLGTDLNTITACGYYDASSPSNGPAALAGVFQKVTVVCSADTRFVTQIAYDMVGGTNASYIRNQTASSWGAWQIVSPPGMWSATGLANTFRMQVATATGCSITTATALASCVATVNFPVSEPDMSYNIVGCQIIGSSSDAALGNITAFSTTGISIKEFTLLSTTVTAGTIACLIVHN